MNRTLAFFERVILLIRRQLERIARSSEGDHSVDDLTNETWLIVDELHAAPGANPDPEDESLREAIIERLHRQFGRFANRKERFAARIDRDDVGHDGELMESSVAARLAAPEAYEPHVALEQREERDRFKQALDARFSEAVAYLRVLDHFDGNRVVIAQYLAIPLGALNIRLKKSERFAESQPSMFDGIERIPDDFLPPRGTPRRLISARRFHHTCTNARPWQTHLFLQIGALLGRGRRLQ